MELGYGVHVNSMELGYGVSEDSMELGYGVPVDSMELGYGVSRGGSRGPKGPRLPLTTKNEAPAPKFYKIEAPEWQF